MRPLPGGSPHAHPAIRTPPPLNPLRILACALPTLQKELSAAESSKGKDAPELIPILRQLSGAYRDKGQFLAALPLSQRALDINKKVHAQDKDDVQIAADLDLLGTLYRLSGDNKSSLENYRQALAIVEKKLEPDHPAKVTLLTNLAMTCLASGNTAEAETALQNAMAIANKDYGAAAQEATYVQVPLGELYLRTGRFAKAEQTLVFALTVRSEALDVPLVAGQTTEAQGRFYMAPAENVLGRLYTVVGLYEKAGPLLEDALKDSETMFGKNHPLLEDLLANLVAFSKATGDTDKAASYQKRLDEIFQNNIGIAYPASFPKPKSVETSLPVASGRKLYADVRVGDWVVYHTPGGPPDNKRELIKKTPLVALILNHSWNPAKKVWEPSLEEIIDLGADAKQLYDVSDADLHTEKAQIKDAPISCSTGVTTQGRSKCKICRSKCKIYLAPDIVPLGGLVKVECEGQIVMQATDFGRAK